MRKHFFLLGLFLLSSQMAFSKGEEEEQNHSRHRLIQADEVQNIGAPVPQRVIPQFQNLFGNVALNLGMNIQEQQQAVAAMDDVTMAMFDEILQDI